MRKIRFVPVESLLGRSNSMSSGFSKSFRNVYSSSISNNVKIDCPIASSLVTFNKDIAISLMVMTLPRRSVATTPSVM